MGVSTVADGFALDEHMFVEVSKEAGTNAFEVTLFRREHRYFDDDPQPDIVETAISEATFECSLPALFQAVSSWLLDTHHLRALPHSWTAGDCGGSAGYELLLAADALPICTLAGRKVSVS